MSKAVPWRCEQLHRNSFNINIPLTRNRKWEFWLLAASDTHIDSIHCNRKLLTKHLKEAQSRDAAVIMPGDVADCMQGRDDKRRSKAELKACYNVDNYWDKLVEDLADYLKPYSQNLAVMSIGNHEQSVLRDYETDILQRLIGYLNITTKSSIFYGHYAGWLTLSLKDPRGYSQCFKRIKYHHGTGFSKTNAASKYAAAQPDADIILLGDKHVRWSETVGRDRVSLEGKPYVDRQLLLGMPGYKDEYGDGAKGYAVQKGFRPSTLGGWWLRFYWDRGDEKVAFEAIEAA